MKRIYIIAVLFLMGIWPATAQPFWHPDLGNAPAGSIPLSYDTTSYSFETTGGLDSGYDTEAMKNSLIYGELYIIHKILYIFAKKTKLLKNGRNYFN